MQPWWAEEISLKTLIHLNYFKQNETTNKRNKDQIYFGTYTHTYTHKRARAHTRIVSSSQVSSAQICFFGLEKKKENISFCWLFVLFPFSSEQRVNFTDDCCPSRRRETTISGVARGREHRSDDTSNGRAAVRLCAEWPGVRSECERRAKGSDTNNQECGETIPPSGPATLSL